MSVNGASYKTVWTFMCIASIVTIATKSVTFGGMDKRANTDSHNCKPKIKVTSKCHLCGLFCLVAEVSRIAKLQKDSEFVPWLAVSPNNKYRF